MKKPRATEKLLLSKILDQSAKLKQAQKGLEIGEIISLIRKQLGMSQRTLSKRAKTPQATISQIEMRTLSPNINTLEKILNALEFDLVITAAPRQNLETIKRSQAKKKAVKKVAYLQGTMSLEKQLPSDEFLHELIENEIKNLLDSPSTKLWEND